MRTKYSRLAYLEGDLGQWSVEQLVGFLSSLDGCLTLGLQEERDKDVVECAENSAQPQPSLKQRMEERQTKN